jgi:hypothetical protein
MSTPAFFISMQLGTDHAIRFGFLPPPVVFCLEQVQMH